MKRLFILLILIYSTKSEKWLKEVNGHNPSDEKNGYSGRYNNPFTDFYLCSERIYKVHYKNSDNNIWSENFTACQPVGNGSEIDAIAIDGGFLYGSQSNKKWNKNVTNYDISDKDGYVGNIGEELDAIFIYGDEYYRSGYSLSDSTNEKNVSYRIIENFFSVKYFNFSYVDETEVSLKEGTKLKLTVKLLSPYQLKFKGKITYKSLARDIIFDNSINIFSNNLKILLNKTIDFDFDKIEKKIIRGFSIRLISFGDVFFNFNWEEKLIEIEVASKIQTEDKVDYHGYRGGFIIKMYLNDQDDDLLSKVTQICKIIVQYSGVKIPSFLKKKLSSNFESFIDVGEVLNYIGDYSIIAEKVIFFEIFSRIYIPKPEDDY
jgi:hypothetical protein